MPGSVLRSVVMNTCFRSGPPKATPVACASGNVIVPQSVTPVGSMTSTRPAVIAVLAFSSAIQMLPIASIPIPSGRPAGTNGRFVGFDAMPFASTAYFVIRPVAPSYCS